MTQAEKVKRQQEWLGMNYEKAVAEGTFTCILKRVCPYCGNAFYTCNNRQIYCPDTFIGTSCAVKANQARQKAYRAEERKSTLQKTCAVCGRTFTAKKVDALYCSAACKQKAYRRRVTNS